MNFENINCDGCGRKLEKSEDIVVCPVCGTPQHRECYEKNGACVNASKHNLEFEWKSPVADENEKPKLKTVACPVCGALNDENTLKCHSCGANINAADNDKPDFFIHDEKGFFSGMDVENPDDIPDLNEVIEERVKALAPGITADQRREQLCGHEIGKTVSFIGNNAASYATKFRKKEQMGKRTFNWAAFFFTPIWFFWRRLYKQGIVYMTISIIISILMSNPIEEFYNIYQGIIDSGAQTIPAESLASLQSAMIPVFFLEAAFFILHLIAGFTADGMYHKYCQSCLNTIDELSRTQDNVTTLSYYLKRSSTGFLATLLAMIAYYFLPALLSYLFM